MICVTDLRECSIASMIEDLLKESTLKSQETTQHQGGVVRVLVCVCVCTFVYCPLNIGS